MKFLSFMWNPLSWVMEAAAIMAIALANGGVSTVSLLRVACFSESRRKKSTTQVVLGSEDLSYSYFRQMSAGCSYGN